MKLGTGTSWGLNFINYMILLILRRHLETLGHWGHKDHLLFPKPCIHDWAWTHHSLMKFSGDTTLDDHWKVQSLPLSWTSTKPPPLTSSSLPLELLCTPPSQTSSFYLVLLLELPPTPLPPPPLSPPPLSASALPDLSTAAAPPIP